MATLAIAIGNTNIKTGYISPKGLVTNSYPKDTNPTQLHSAANTDISKILVASVVPHITQGIIDTFANQNITEITKAGVPINTSPYDTTLVGIDRLLNCYGAWAIYNAPAIVFDLGTAISISVVGKGGVFLGGAILPGVEMGLKALSQGTALLPHIDTYSTTVVVGSNTAACLASGAVHGTASIIDGMAKKIQNELGYKCTSILTGGFAPHILAHTDITHHPHLLLEALLALGGTNQ